MSSPDGKFPGKGQKEEGPVSRSPLERSCFPPFRGRFLLEVPLQQALEGLAVSGLNLILTTKTKVEYHFYFPKTPISHQFPFRNWIFGKRDIIRDFVSLETSQRNMNHTIQSMKATMKVKPRRPAGLYFNYTHSIFQAGHPSYPG